jgi:ParB-like chromosome segregation protein Spo0J
MADDLLGIYLNDHLGGSAAGTELSEKLRDNNQGTELGNLMAALHNDIEQDRASLEELMERLGIERQRIKQAAGWVLEKLTRLRLNPALAGNADLTRMLETEALSLGIEGKLSMWLALREAAAGDPRLAGTDYDRLIERARSQRQALEPHRRAAALQAFSSGD